MLKGSTQAKHEMFIKLMVDVDTVAQMIVAYKKAYPTCKTDASARVLGYRKLLDVNVVQAIDKLKKEKEEVIREAVKAERIKLAKESVVHESEIDAALSRIVTGVHKRKKAVVVFNRATEKYEQVKIDEEVTAGDIVNAADKLFKRKGSYAPATVKHEGGDQLLEFFKQVAKTTNAKIKNDV